MDRKIMYFVATLLILGGGAGSYIYYSETRNSSTVTQPTVTITDTKQANGSISEGATEVVREMATGAGASGVVSDKIAAKIPNLDRPIIMSGSVNPAFEEETVNKIKSLITLLKQDPNLFNEWIDLGLLWKSVEDYEGAREAWEYASAIRPKNSLSFYNLGVLYGYYLKNQARAEANFLQAVENSPALDYLYPQVVDFYLEVVHSKEKAAAFLGRSMAAHPDIEVIKQLRQNLGI